MNSTSRSSNTGAFRFKRFQLSHSEGTWKVGTDSVLLGSWCRVDGVTRAMDMGTGSGILSLMIAQRNPNVRIDAIEVSEPALEVAMHNFRSSPWKDRIELKAWDLSIRNENFMQNYDLVVCNPPYYPDGLISGAEVRKVSRQGIGFSIWDVPRLSMDYTSQNGYLVIVIPEKCAYKFVEEANQCGLHVRRRLAVRHSRDSQVSLVLLEMTRMLEKPEHRTLILYKDVAPSQEYLDLCEDFISP